MAKAKLVSTEFVAAAIFGETGHYIYGWIGNNGDEVPTDNVTTGSWFLEKDTGVINFFDEDSGEWAPLGGGGES